MMRSGLEQDAVHASLFVTPGNGVVFQRRVVTGGTSASVSGGALAQAVSTEYPVWLRLVKTGAVVVASRSVDGVVWEAFASQSIDLGETVYVGLAVTSHAPAQLATATMDSILLDASGAPPLPSPWTFGDVGAVGAPGFVEHATGGPFTVHGSGADIWGAADGFALLKQPLVGNGEITARVASLTAANTWAKAGVMLRASEGAGSPHAMVALTPGNGVAFQRRRTEGGASISTSNAALTGPVWVRLRRTGDLISAWTSPDGATWALLGSDRIAGLPQQLWAGLAVTSHVHGTLARATFESVIVQAGSSQSLPVPWQGVDVGAMVFPGLAQWEAAEGQGDTGTFFIHAAGSDIWNAADNFHYVYQPLHGGGSLVAQVNGPVNGSDWAKAGLMIRASLDPNAANVALLMAPGRGLVLQQRTSNGATTTNTMLDAAATGPQWLKLERSGNSIFAHRSLDGGATWTLLATRTVPAIGYEAFVGFASCAHNAQRLAYATFTEGAFTVADVNSDGIGDWWAMQYFGTITVDPNAQTPSGDGRTLLQAYESGLDPTDFYQGVAPVVTIAGGNNQSGEADAFVAEPLKVLITNAEGTPLVNAPVTFTRTTTGGGVAETSGGVTLAELSPRTDATGHAEVWFRLPSAASAPPSTITAAAGTAEPVTFTASIAQTLSGDGMAGWWKLDETTGTAVADSSTANNNGTLAGAAQRVPGAFAKALQLNGVGQYVTVPHSSSLGLGGTSLTLSAWFKAGATNVAAPILAKCSSDADGFHGFYLGLTPSGAVEFRLGANVSTRDELAFSTQSTFTDNQWHQVVVHINRETAQARIYVDATPRALSLASPSLGTISTESGPGAPSGTIATFPGAENLSALTPAALHLGADTTALPSPRYFAGTLDDLRLYTRALTPQDLANLFDRDGDTLPDAWEIQHLGNLSGTAATHTPSGDGLTLGQAHQQGVNPNDYYHGILPSLQIVSGNNQIGPAGQPLPLPLQVRVMNQAGQPLANAPVTFAVANGSGTLSTSTARTDSLGIAEAHLNPAGSPGDGIEVRATPPYVASAGHVSFAATVGETSTGQSPTPGGGGDGPNIDPFVPPPTLPTPVVSITYAAPGEPYTPIEGYDLNGALKGRDFRKLKLKWTSSGVNDVTYVVQRREDNGPWQTIATTPATELSQSNLYSLINYQYQVIARSGKSYSLPGFASARLPFIAAVLGEYTYHGELQYPFYEFFSIYFIHDFNLWVPPLIIGEGEEATEIPWEALHYRFEFIPSKLNFQYGIYGGNGPFPVSANAPFLDSQNYEGFDYIKSQEFIEVEGQWPSVGRIVKIAQNQKKEASFRSWTLNWDFPREITLQITGDLGSFVVTNYDEESAPLGNNVILDPWDFANGTLIIKPNAQANAGDTIHITAINSELGRDSVRFTYRPTEEPKDYSMPLDEASGPKYRKIALNGLPLSDEKPQQTEESDQEREETFVDALTIGLRHSTTDVYMPVSGSDFAVAARRDFRSEIWKLRAGLRVHEHPDRPFGACWSSNLSPNIHFTVSTDPNADNGEPPQVHVTDETGAVHTFMEWSDDNGVRKFFPMPSAKNEQQTPNLTSLTLDVSSTPVTFTFKRKYGSTLIYKMTPLELSIPPDRRNGSPHLLTHKYARLVEATDRVGNKLVYEFANATNLVPMTIKVQDQPGIVLSIEQNSDGRITALWDANGNKTSFTYSTHTYDADAGAAPILTNVTTADGAVTTYTYAFDYEEDTTPRRPNEPGYPSWHADLATITDPLLRTYTFSYDKLDNTGPGFDHTKQTYMDNPVIYTGYYPQSGLPRPVTKITMPDGSVSTFSSDSEIKILFNNGNPVLDGHRKTIVTDATGFVRTYRFEDAQIIDLPKFRKISPSTGRSDSKIICYQTMVLEHGLSGTGTYMGSETFKFNVEAAMALKEVTDFSGNTTTFTHGDTWTASEDYRYIMTNIAVNGYYGDPTSQTNALGDTKTFTYSGESRIMSSVTDEEGRRTEYEVDALGRRTKESVFAPGASAPIQVTEMEYGSTTFPGVMTKSTRKALAGAGDPAWVQDLVTEYVLDANGRVAQEVVDPAGLAITNSNTYDANGSRLTTTDPRGNTTWFYYDNRNRVVRVTYADGTSQSMVYDLRGNKLSETNENGFKTLYQYDVMNRTTSKTRDMNRDGVVDAGDITTSFAYNAVGSNTLVTGPTGGVTETEFDSLQRPVKITDALGNETTLVYGTNSGGSAFNTSGFKPTSTTDPRGFVTTVTYDDLYRPVQTSVEYELRGATAVSSTQYDKVSNVVLSTDPLNRQTSVTYDALNRPLVTTNADLTTTQIAYTSTGLKHRTTNERGHSADMEYDAAGRQTVSYAPPVNNGLGGTARPTSSNVYDPAGNVISTINPLGQQWDNVFDSRNRKIQEISPLVYDAESGTESRPTKTMLYDAGGRTISVTDSRGNTATTAFDDADRAIHVFSPPVPLPGGGVSQPHTQNVYDASGNVLAVTDPLGRVTHNVYDLLNRLTSTTDASGITVSYEYDEVGNRTKVTDGLNRATTFTYDGLKRNLTSTNPLSQTVTYTYNAVNKTRRTDALGNITDYTFDARNRSLAVIYNSADAINSIRHFTYDGAGNILTVTEPAKGAAATVTYTYDALNRASTETSGGATHTYVYDLAGNRLQTTYGQTGRTIVSTYDALNRLMTMAEGSNITQYFYDHNSSVVCKILPNGDTETAGFDSLNRAIYQHSRSASGRALCLINYAHDVLGNVIRVEEFYPAHLPNRTVTNSYDLSNRLTTEAITYDGSNLVTPPPANVTTAYTFDKANNRTSKVVTGGETPGATEYTYNAYNQLLNYSDGTRTVTLTYDAAGNRATRTVTGGDDSGSTLYSYDFENRLVRLETTPTSGAPKIYTYTYDYRTRRIVRDESQAGGQATKVVFSGGTSAFEVESGVVTVENIRGSDYGGGVGGVLYSLRNGIPSFAHANKRGDIIARTDSAGGLTYLGQYEAYGTRPHEYGASADRQRGNSKDEDPTGLLNEGFRYRDLETGSFITADPAGFVNGPNVYTYVVCNPWSKFDPEGLFWSAALTVGMALYDTYQYRTGQMSADDYTQSMALNTAALVADVATGGMGGGLAVRATNLAIKAAKVIDKADTVASVIVGGVNTAKAIESGDITGSMKNAALTAVGAKATTKGPDLDVPNTGKMDIPGGETAKGTCGKNGGCFVAGTLVATTDNLTPIESLEVGQRVRTPQGDVLLDCSSADSKESLFRVSLRLVASEPPFDSVEIVLLRTSEWLVNSHCRPVAGIGTHSASAFEIWLDLREIGITGWAEIKGISASPAITRGRGQLITGTFSRNCGNLFEVRVGGQSEPIHVTGSHRIFSVTRNSWVPAGNLLKNELLRTAVGDTQVLQISPISGLRSVYNIEVDKERCYYIGTSRILVHNEYGGDASKPTQWDETANTTNLGGGKTKEYTTRPPDQTQQLRDEFNAKDVGDRAIYLKTFAENARPEFMRRFSPADLSKMKSGLVPDDWVVHHIVPLSRGGSNAFENLRLMKRSFHENKNISEKLHNYEPGKNPYGRN
ncbi:hypothetical protein DB346_12900 [Verrucomicrobia bacterium LW23]|nr:hypothetical protein DB346_12900 [Verrucomicrobia bacterium LW23]